VLYIDQIQRADVPAATALFYGKATPVHTVRIHGIDYAEIYQVPLPVAQPLDADFGQAIHFRGYDVVTSAASSALGLTVHWQTRAAIAEDLMLFIHVLDAQGARVGGVDVPPGGGGEPTSAWRPGSYVSAALQVPIQPNLAPGSYWLALGLYDPSTSERLAVRADQPAGAPSDGANALLIGPIPLK